ncbi:hypothetical protein D915_005578 [Fasciola hepatica]|uniref:BAG domain-containing protein n=1 Tax=Fasciola hepatica TaxID=6192 RepID=A0A4E0RAH8_FASHE|nr:hypothetical protein D915_005578 [Fasciola hepatica]
MAGSGLPPDWVRDDPYYDTHNRVRLDPFGNRYISRPDTSPSGRSFDTSPFYEDRMHMPGFPQHSMFENYPDFPTMPSDPMWSDFGSEFRQSRPQTPSSTSGMRRIPIQVVKHPVTVIPGTCTSTSQNPPKSAQTAPSGSSNFEHSKSAQNTHPSPTEVSDGISNRDVQTRRDWHQPRQFKPEDQISYQNNGTAPCFAQQFPAFPTRRRFQPGSCSPDMFTGKEFPSSASDTDHISHAGGGGGQFRPIKVHHIPISRQDKPGTQPDRTDFDSLKPPMPEGTAIPLHYQSLPNRPFVTPRDLPVYGQTPSPTMRSEPPISESEVTTPTETVASPIPTSKPSLTPSEQIDQALADLMEIRAQIDAFSSSTEDKTYMYLEDRLDKMLLKFDGIDTGGEDTVRQKRKQAVRDTLDAIGMLEKKLASHDQVNNNSSSTPVTKTADTSALNKSLDLVAETKPTTQKPESVIKTETEVQSGTKTQTEEPTQAMELEQQSENSNRNGLETQVQVNAAEPADSHEATINHTNNGNTVEIVATEPAGN